MQRLSLQAKICEPPGAIWLTGDPGRHSAPAVYGAADLASCTTGSDPCHSQGISIHRTERDVCPSGNRLSTTAEALLAEVRCSGVDGSGLARRLRNQVAAIGASALRGAFYSSNDKSSRWEELQYRGLHLAEAFVVRKRDRTLVGSSEPFYVIIE
jgi:Adenylyl/Guanylyl and SMODS C-terminal sensor domain